MSTKVLSLIRSKWFFSLLAVALVTVAATPPAAQNTDEQYIQIMTLIDKADALRASGKADAAKAKYKEAQIALVNFKRANPLWNTKTIAFRLTEVTERLETRPPVQESIPKAAPLKKVEPKLEVEKAAAASGSKSLIKLLSTGAEPRKALRWHVKAGEKQTAIMTLKLSMELPMPGAQGQTPKIPPVTMPLDVTVEKVEPNGDISYQMALGEGSMAEDPGTPADMIKGAKQAFGSVKGLTVSGVMTSRGVNKSMEFKSPPGGDPKTQQGLEKLNEQLKENLEKFQGCIPEEVVGVGAKWEVTLPDKDLQGITADQKLTFELVSMDGDHVSLSFNFTQTAGSQTIQNSTMVPLPINLASMKGNASGTAVIDLSKFVPMQMSADYQIEINGDVAMGKKKQPIAVKFACNFGLEAK